MKLSVATTLLLCGAVKADFKVNDPSVTLAALKQKDSTLLKHLSENVNHSTGHQGDTHNTFAKIELFCDMLEKLVPLRDNKKPVKDSVMADFLKAISDKDLAAYGSFLAPGLGRYLDSTAKNSRVKTLILSNPKYARNAVREYKRSRPNPDPNVITFEYVKIGGPDVLVILASNNEYSNNSLLPKMSKDFWAAFKVLEKKQIIEHCSAIKGKFIKHASRDNVSGINPICFASLQNVTSNGTDLTSRIPSMSTDIFACMLGPVDELNAKAITANQLAKYNITGDAAKRCTLLALHAVTPTAFRKVTADCLASYLMSPASQPLGKLWREVPANLFDSLSEIHENMATIVSKIHSEDRKFFNDDLVNKLLTYEGVAEALPEKDEWKAKAKFVLTPATAFKLTDKSIFIRALQTLSALDSMILSHLNAEYFENLEATLNNRTYNGLEVLDLMTSENKKACMPNLSKNVEFGVHACSLVSDIETYKGIKALAFAAPECYEHFNFDVKLEDMKKVPALVRGKTWESISKEFSDEELAKMPVALFSEIVATPDFCSIVKEETFKKINTDALSAIDSNCLTSLTFKISAFAGHVKRFKDAVFEQTTVSQWKALGLSLDNINDKQLAHLSMKVEKTEEMITSGFNQAQITGLGKRITVLNAKQISSLCPKVVPALPLAQISADALVLVTPEQLTALIPDFAKLSAVQVEKIGSQNTNVAGVNKILEDNKSKLSAEGLTAWIKRAVANDNKPTPPVEESSSISWKWIIAGCLAIVVIGGVVFFFVRK